ncbi:kinase-like protein [Rhizoclosmatium globosum]|uniref:Kinase-like protein n=1 Tax=Rhizoclosmatium globosum TaxID=329046 RepID=A0A1Y2CKU4_9FUNG|nr:kinase-like protein [Rhizoclosmatium globosum]|eukprot:ORY46945.1 kinase-like protein [Rhizoclosmatium globosum]
MFSNTNTDSSRHNSAASTASSPVTTSATKAQTTFPDQKSIYQNRTPEESARIAVFAAFVSSPVHFEQKYSVKRVIGFGSNGVVLAATQGSTTGVAIKIIYKSKPSFNAPNPPEIDILLQLSKSTSTSSNLLHYIEHWQDAQNHYLVTELHGSDWLASTSPSLTPLSFTIPTTKKSYTFPIASGSSDLWAWSFAHRQHLHNTEGHSYLPLHPVKRIVKQIALALQEMHGNGYYHGDVKIENVLVGSDVSVRLADFGHSRHVSQGIKRMVQLKSLRQSFFRTLGLRVEKWMVVLQMCLRLGWFCLCFE